MTTTRTLQSGGWTWAGSSRMLWSRWGSLGSSRRGKNGCSYPEKHLWCLTGPLTVRKCITSCPRSVRHESDSYDDRCWGRREERGVKMQFKNRLVVHAGSSGPLSNKVFRRSSHRNKRPHVLHLWSALTWGGGHVWRVTHLSHMSGHYLCLISPHVITSWLKVNSFQKKAICALHHVFHCFLIRQKPKLLPKINPALQSSVNTSVLLFVTCIILSWQLQAARQSAEEKNKRNTFRWKSDMIAQNMRTDSPQKLCRGAGKTTAALEEICGKKKKLFD